MGLVNTGIKKYPMCTIKYTAVFLMLWTYISAGGIATGTYFERGGGGWAGLRNKIGGGGGCHVTRVIRDTMIQKRNFC